MSLSVLEYDRARLDPEVFADLLVGRPLWPHQAEVVRSPARLRAICAGRRAGKSQVFGVLALHQAFAVPGSKVLIVSAGEVAAKRLFREVATMAAAPLLGGSVVDESTSTLVLSNGSRVECVPASVRQTRSAEADLLIIDEAGFVGQDIWEAAEPVVLARPGSRVLLASSPWGSSEHFFRVLWTRGMDNPDEHVESWHWRSDVSPLVDTNLLEQIRLRSSADYFEREYLALWTDDAGAYFTTAELDNATADYRMTRPEDLPARMSGAQWEEWMAGRPPFAAGAGVDWGMARDANALVLLAPLDDHGLNMASRGEELVLFVPWFEARSQWPYTEFIDRIVEVSRHYQLPAVASERNGPGEMPTSELTDRLYRARTGSWVTPVWTDLRRKQSMFGALKMWLQAGRLVLPREPELLKQLRSLEFEQLPAGGMRIAVPDRLGHDDIALALGQASSTISLWSARAGLGERSPGDPADVVRTPGGVLLPRQPLPMRGEHWFQRPRGAEAGDGW